MAIGYFQRNTASDVTGAKQLLRTGGAAVNLTHAIAGGTTDLVIETFISEPNDPNDTSWEAGDWTVEIDLTSIGADVTLKARVKRCNSAGADLQTIGTSAGQGTTGVQVHTINQASPITAGATDRIKIEILASRGASHGNQAADFEVNTADSEVIAPLAGGVTEKAAADTLGVAAGEQQTSLVGSQRADNADLAAADAATLAVLLNAIDTAGLAAQEATASVVVSLTVSDSLNLAAVEAAPGIASSLTRSDALELTSSESQSSLLFSTRSDQLDVTLVEATALSVVLAAADTASLAALESAPVLQSQLDRSDSLDLALGEGQTSFLSSQRAEALDLAAADAAAVLVALTGADSVALAAVEGSILALVLTVSDGVALGLAESQGSFLASSRAEALTLALSEQLASSLGSSRADSLDLGAEESAGLSAVLTAGDLVALSLDESSAVAEGAGPPPLVPQFKPLRKLPARSKEDWFYHPDRYL